MTRLTSLALFCMASFGCSSAPVEDLPLIELTEPPELFPAELNGPADAVRELSDGRVALLEKFEPSITILDWDDGSRVQVGRQGRGPGEFEQPHALLLVYPDTLALLEAVGRKIHFYTTEGEFLRSGQLPPGPFFVTASLFADTTGWIYLVGPGSPLVASGSGDDSLAVFRFRAGQLAVDSIWMMGTSPLLRMPTERGSTRMPLVFSDQDAIGVSADGRVIRASARLQRLDQWREGAVSSLGAPWGFVPARVTQRDRDSVTRERSAIGIYRGIRLSFADYKTVFDRLVVAPNGEAWVRLTLPRAGKQVYRVFAVDGSPKFDVALPPESLLAGIGAEYLYVLRFAEGGTPRYPEEADQLGRVRLPDG